MKLRVFASPLADAVSYTAKALPSRAPIPVLMGMLLATGTEGLSLSASDTEVYTAATVPAEVADDGRVLVPGRLLADICARLPKNAEVDLELEADGARLVLLCGTARFTLPTLPVEEYPTLPGLPAAVATVQADVFADAVAQVAVAASTDTALPALTGVQLRLNGAELILAATDRYRIGRRMLTVRPTGTVPAAKGKRRRKPDAGEAADPAAEVAKALVPARALAEAAKALEGEHTLTLHWADGLVGLSIPGGRSYATRLLTGYEFPQTDGLMDSEWLMTLTIPVTDAIAAVQRVALVATRNTPIRLVLAAGAEELRIEAGSGDDAQALDRIPVNVEGAAESDDDGDFTIAFNPGFLTDGLKALGTPEAEFHIRHPHKPSLVLGRAGEVDQDYQHLLMPVRLG